MAKKVQESTGEVLIPQVIENSEIQALQDFRDDVLQKKEELEHEAAVNTAAILEVVGMFKTHKISEQFNKTLCTIKLREIRESKEYKNLTILDVNGQPAIINSWAEFCRALGTSKEKVDKDIQNLNTFGQEFMQLSESLGLSYRQLQRMRQNMTNPALTESEKLALAEAKNKDPNELLMMLEDLQDKQAIFEDKQAKLEETIEELKKDNESKAELIEKKTKKINMYELKTTESAKQVEKNRLFNTLEMEFSKNIAFLQNAKVAFLEGLRLQENGELDEQENDRFNDAVLQFLTNVMRFSSEIRTKDYNFIDAVNNLGLLWLFELYLKNNISDPAPQAARE